MSIKICAKCHKEFTPLEAHHDYCLTCYRRLHNQCIICGKPLSQTAIDRGYLRCYDCFEKHKSNEKTVTVSNSFNNNSGKIDFKA